MSDELQVDISERVATLTLNRPEKLNAITPSMAASLRQTLAVLGQRDDVQVIIVTGAGRGFCAGADMGRLTAIADGSAKVPGSTGQPINANARAELQLRYNFFAAVPQPVIASVNGPAAGIGFVLALYADLRFAANEASFMTGFARRGLIAEHGSAWGLSRLVGPGHAADLLLSSRKVGGEEAARIGLVNRAMPGAELAAYTREYALEMAKSTSPRSLTIIKSQLWALPFQDMGEAFADGDRLMQESLSTQDFKEGIAHFLEKREPRFTGR